MPTRVGKYKILRQIAQGGMAEIYLATAVGIEGFEKLCVLKRILPMLASNHEFVEMFLDEARIAGSLLHSNIAQVFDIGSDAGNYYFVMEFLRGEDVRHILMRSVERHEPIAYEHIVSIITGVCSGLHYAHEMRGRDGKELSIVHRDISPQNVFVTHDGNVKLCDFGIAKSAAQLTETRVGTLKGKIRYMAPEQCQAEPLDRRSDIFALSIVLWELITQRRLYRGKSDFEIFKAIVEEDAPPPSTYRGDVPAGLEAVVMKGLRRNRDERYETAQELQVALEDWARSERVPASPVRLAAYMKDLFGAPPQLESILEQVSEDDPLAKRIRSLNVADDSGGSQTSLPRLRATASAAHNLGEDATLAGTKRNQPDADAADDEDTSFSKATTGRSTSFESGLSNSALRIGPRRVWWPYAVGGAAVLGVVVMLSRGTTPAVSAKPPVSVAPAPKPAARPVVAPEPIDPPVAPPRAVGPRSTGTPAPPVRPKRHVRKPQPTKKGQPLDDLLPP
ncbi:MAG: serine/threonine-protein kinase [Polyangia bacterium]